MHLSRSMLVYTSYIAFINDGGNKNKTQAKLIAISGKTHMAAS